MDNPKHAEAEREGRYTDNIAKYIHFYRECSGDLEVPRGFAAMAPLICEEQGENINVIDNRVEVPVQFQFHGTLKPFQDVAVSIMLQADHGVLESSTESRKTVMALNIISARGQRAWIIVHNKELLNQWINRIEKFLGIAAGEVGIIGGGKFCLGENITVGMVQTLCKRVDDIRGQFGMIVVDECHRSPSKTFTDELQFVFAHNHPSGDVSPSPEDVGINKRFTFYFKWVGVNLHGHVTTRGNAFKNLTGRLSRMVECGNGEKLFPK